MPQKYVNNSGYVHLLDQVYLATLRIQDQKKKLYQDLERLQIIWFRESFYKNRKN